jgi:hypothetical protein
MRGLFCGDDAAALPSDIWEDADFERHEDARLERATLEDLVRLVPELAPLSPAALGARIHELAAAGERHVNRPSPCRIGCLRHVVGLSAASTGTGRRDRTAVRGAISRTTAAAAPLGETATAALTGRWCFAVKF